MPLLCGKIELRRATGCQRLHHGSNTAGARSPAPHVHPCASPVREHHAATPICSHRSHAPASPTAALECVEQPASLTRRELFTRGGGAAAAAAATALLAAGGAPSSRAEAPPPPSPPGPPPTEPPPAVAFPVPRPPVGPSPADAGVVGGGGGASTAPATAAAAAPAQQPELSSVSVESYLMQLMSARQAAWPALARLISAGAWIRLSQALVQAPFEDVRLAAFYVPWALLQADEYGAAVAARKAYLDFVQHLNDLAKASLQAADGSADGVLVQQAFILLSASLDGFLAQVPQKYVQASIAAAREQSALLRLR